MGNSSTLCCRLRRICAASSVQYFDRRGILSRYLEMGMNGDTKHTMICISGLFSSKGISNGEEVKSSWVNGALLLQDVWITGLNARKVLVYAISEW